MTPLHPPKNIADDLRRLTVQELSLPSRLRYLALMLLASMMTAVVVGLLVTEPGLPVRTAWAFLVLAAMGLTWAAFAAWVLTRRRILLASHRVVAARIAVAFCSVFVIGSAGVGMSTSRPALFAAAATGAAMLAVAVAASIRANRRFSELSRRRDELSRLAEGGRR